MSFWTQRKLKQETKFSPDSRFIVGCVREEMGAIKKQIKRIEINMNQQVQEFLKQINYIEADMEIQRQILCSIPSSDREEMEKTIELIARKKTMVEELRQKIKDADPLAFEKIIAFEKATNKFKQIAAEKKFIEVKTPNENESCNLKLKKENKTIECLVKAKDEAGGYTIISYDGEIHEFSNDEVRA